MSKEKKTKIKIFFFWQNKNLIIYFSSLSISTEEKNILTKNNLPSNIRNRIFQDTIIIWIDKYV